MDGQASQINTPEPQPSRRRGGGTGQRGQRGGQRRGGGSHGPRGNAGSRRGPEQAEAENDRPSPAGQPSFNRGVRGGLRAGRAGTRLISGSQRHFGTRVSVEPETSGTAGPSSLSGAAPEFVPGQPVSLPIRGAPGTPVPAPPAGSGPGHGSSSGRRAAPRPKPSQTPKLVPKSSAPDLPTRIHEDIANGQYDCVICMNEVLPTSQIWSCPTCWICTHQQCAEQWYRNNIKAAQEEAARQAAAASQPPEQAAAGRWRCPGCNTRMPADAPPRPHACWCGKDPNPRSIPGLPPHSCGQTCARPRTTPGQECPHPCSLVCHAGPCPPCTLNGPTVSCFCGRSERSWRCSEGGSDAAILGKGWSCGEPCGDLLSCGEHKCERPCHPGLCGGCDKMVMAVCYCGKTRREIACDLRDPVPSFNHGQLKPGDGPAADADGWFEGSFECGETCGRKFDCGFHVCEKPCHSQDEEVAHCPFSPDVVRCCPCGKTKLQELIEKERESCQDEIPRCNKTCEKRLPCGHLCPQRCHVGACAPCNQTVEKQCRCGRTTFTIPCLQGTPDELLCKRVCRAQLNCGRHECGEECCRGEKQASERVAARRKHRGPGPAPATQENFEAEHICTRVCGRPLKCGRHECQQLCHKGACLSCPEAIFEEISCACGRTVLYPPQPCGTKPPECSYDCTRPRTCGHPEIKHHCHQDSVPCPKCPFLVSKTCVCGKQTLRSQPCWLTEAHCGQPCGKKLKCGTHICKKLCHRDGECEDATSHCSQQCGKARKSCEHPCVETCHAPFPCKEDKPCQGKAIVTCPCQTRKQEVKCLATKTSPWSDRAASLALKCDDECLRLQRNAALASALGIDPATHTDDHVPYSDETLRMYREGVGGPGWCAATEREFRAFASADDSKEKRLRFKPMPSAQRAFIHALAEDYGLDSESLDPEPHRHVCVFKTPRFLAMHGGLPPRKTLAQCVRIRAAAEERDRKDARLAAVATASTASATEPPYNALLLTAPRFGLTADELDAVLAPAFAPHKGTLTFTAFFPEKDNDKHVILRLKPTAGTATSPSDSLVTSLKAAVERIVLRDVLAANVLRGTVVDGLSGTRPRVVRIEGRDGDASGGSQGGGGASAIPRGSGDGGGWSEVVGRAARRQQQQPAAAAATAAKDAAAGASRLSFGTVPDLAPRGLLALGKKKNAASTTALKQEDEPVEEDWLEAAEKMEREDKEPEET